MAIWINRVLSAVEELDVRRVFRNGIGDWCAYVDAPDGGNAQPWRREWVFVPPFRPSQI